MDLQQVREWSRATPGIPATVVAPSQVAATSGPLVVAAEYPFGVPWDELRARPGDAVVVLPRAFPGLPDDIAVFDAGEQFAALTSAARNMHPAVPLPAAPPPPTTAAHPRTTQPTGAFTDEDAASERQPTLADSDWLTYIVAGIVGMALTSVLWQNVIPGIIVAVLMVGMLVFADKQYGKGIPRAPS